MTIAYMLGMAKMKSLFCGAWLGMSLLATGCVTGEEADQAIGELRTDSNGCPSYYNWLGDLQEFNTCKDNAILTALPPEGGDSYVREDKLRPLSDQLNFALVLPDGFDEDALVVNYVGSANNGPHGFGLRVDVPEPGRPIATLSIYQGATASAITWPASNGDQLRWHVIGSSPRVWLNGRRLSLPDGIKIQPRDNKLQYTVAVVDYDASGSAIGAGVTGIAFIGVPTPGASPSGSQGDGI